VNLDLNDDVKKPTSLEVDTLLDLIDAPAPEDNYYVNLDLNDDVKKPTSLEVGTLLDLIDASAPEVMNLDFNDDIKGSIGIERPNFHLVKIDFDDDIKEFIDIERPYYALNDEHNIVDPITKESVGFVCTVRREMPISVENGGISFGEVGRYSATAATVAAFLKNPKKVSLIVICFSEHKCM
jgi:hypothetical protein